MSVRNGGAAAQGRCTQQQGAQTGRQKQSHSPLGALSPATARRHCPWETSSVSPSGHVLTHPLGDKALGCSQIQSRWQPKLTLSSVRRSTAPVSRPAARTHTRGSRRKSRLWCEKSDRGKHTGRGRLTEASHVLQSDFDHTAGGPQRGGFGSSQSGVDGKTCPASVHFSHVTGA